jgi:hypothetical protein
MRYGGDRPILDAPALRLKKLAAAPNTKSGATANTTPEATPFRKYKA